jgi:Flp pilus assembly pilin Flp
MKNFLLKAYTKAQILREDHGQDLIEYAMIVALLTLAAIVGIQGVGTAVAGVWTRISGAITPVLAG